METAKKLGKSKDSKMLRKMEPFQNTCTSIQVKFQVKLIITIEWGAQKLCFQRQHTYSHTLQMLFCMTDLFSIVKHTSIFIKHTIVFDTTSQAKENRGTQTQQKVFLFQNVNDSMHAANIVKVILGWYCKNNTYNAMMVISL